MDTHYSPTDPDQNHQPPQEFVERMVLGAKARLGSNKEMIRDQTTQK
jgi:hypothetical protein